MQGPRRRVVEPGFNPGDNSDNVHLADTLGATHVKTKEELDQFLDRVNEKDSTPLDRKSPKVEPVGKTKTTPTSNANLAGQATDFLLRINSFAAFGAQMFGYDATADALHVAKEPFREQVYDALLLDQELCRWIVRGGTNSAKLALIFAYAMLGATVGPVAVLEFRAKQAEKNEPEKTE